MGEIEPALAESWASSDGGRVWTFTLRQGVRWSDGRPLTIEDVLFSLEAIFTRGVATTVRDQLTFNDRPVRWRRLDDRRIQFTTEEPIGLFNQNPRGLAPPKLTWFQDVRFRRAVNHAIDRNTIITQVYTGRATPAWGPVSVGNTFYHNPTCRSILTISLGLSSCWLRRAIGRAAMACCGTLRATSWSSPSMCRHRTPTW